MQWTPFPYIKLSTYADLFRFPWLKYGVDVPSDGLEYMVRLDYNRGKNFAAYLRYKYKEMEHLSPYSQQRGRLQIQYELPFDWVLKTAADVVYRKEQEKDSFGWMASQAIGWKPTTIPFQADLYAAYFHTDDYASRISSYEKNILYAFNMPSFYGEGVRFSFTFQWKLWERLSLSAKFAHTYYFDRDKIGTDLESIDGNQKMDVFALIRYKF